MLGNGTRLHINFPRYGFIRIWDLINFDSQLVFVKIVLQVYAKTFTTEMWTHLRLLTN